MKLIVKNIELYKPISLILYGSYGRNEGSWIKDKNGDFFPYNDYDIMMIIKKKISENSLNSIRKKIAEEIGIRWIDIGQKTVNELSSLRPLIINYDLKYGSNIIYGDTSITNLIPEIASESLPLKDGETLFFTRMWTFLGSLDKRGLKVSRNREDARFFKNQMAKAIFAAIDVILLQMNLYDSSYLKKVKYFKKFNQNNKELIGLTEWALKEKLNPSDSYISSNEIIILYNMVYKFFYKEMYSLLSKYYNYNIKTAKDLEFCYKWKSFSLLKRMKWLILKRNFQMEKIIKLNIAQFYILESYNFGEINYRLLRRGINLLTKIDNSLSINYTWDEARYKAAQMRLSI